MIPTVNQPPAHNGYIYSFTLGPIDNSLIPETKTKIGKCINLENEKTTLENEKSKQAFLQKMRIIIITAMSLLIIASIGGFFAALYFKIEALGVSSIAGILLGAVTLPTGLNFFKATELHLGLNSQTERQRVMWEITRASLQQIAEKYTFDDILGYQLLDSIVSKEKVHEDKRATFYLRYQQLAVQYNQLESLRRSSVQNMYKLSSNHTDALRNWRSAEVNNINNCISLLHQKANKIKKHSLEKINGNFVTYENHTIQNNSPTLSAKSISTLFTLEQRLAEVNYIFDQQMAPWNEWEKVEKEAIWNTVSPPLQIIEDSFSNYKAEAIA